MPQRSAVQEAKAEKVRELERSAEKIEMKPGEPLNIDDFAPLSKLVRGFELDPEKTYLLVCDAKDFSFEHAHALMKDVREMHPNINIAIVASTKSKGIEVLEKKADDSAEHS